MAALHLMRLVALTHTPSPMDFLNAILCRPDNERPFLLLPIDYPTDDTTVPDLRRKSLNEVLVWNRGEKVHSNNVIGAEHYCDVGLKH